MRVITTNFMRGFLGSFMLAAALFGSLYSTIASFVKHEGIFEFNKTKYLKD